MRLLASALILSASLSLAPGAFAQECPPPMMGSDGFWSIKLPTVELKMKPGTTSSELILSQVSPVSGETETHRATITRDGPVSERTALLQVNRYDLNATDLTITAEVTAVLAAGYTPSGALNIGYGAQEGGFLALVDGDAPSAGCYPYPEEAAFGEWTQAISVVGFDIGQLSSGIGALQEELRQCRAQKSTLEGQVTGVNTQNEALRNQIRLLEAELEKTKLAASRRIFDLRVVIRQIFNEAQDGVKRRYPGDRQALLALRKQLVIARKANGRNVKNSSNVITANRNSVR